MKKPTLLPNLALGAWCALLTAQAQPAAPTNPPASRAEPASEPADEILPLVQFEEAPLVDVIKTLARQAHLNIIIDPRIMPAGQTGKSRPVSIRLENTTAQKVLETVLNNNNLRLERDPTNKLSRVALKDPATEGHEMESMPPVVVNTLPVSGAKDVAPGPAEIKVTFSKEMTDNSWSWSSAWQGSTPETMGKPRYEADRKTCVLQVKLEPNKTYAYWLNSEKFKNFKDQQAHPAVPYLLAFQTTDQRAASRRSDVANPEARLNEDQRLVLAWTDQQFRNFFDARTFDGWAEKERADLETRLLDTLKGPQTREYYQAINTLAALRSTNGLPALRAIALDRRDKDNRDRWMAIRALGNIGDKMSVPEMIHLVYHGNVNTRWWAQIALVQLTAQNFGKDWEAWGKWWNETRAQPAFKPDIIRWWSGQAEPEKLADSLEEGDRKFFEKLKPPAGAPAALQTK
jgi:RNA polymerase sigma-70 factor (ECF subfamily)